MCVAKYVKERWNAASLRQEANILIPHWHPEGLHRRFEPPRSCWRDSRNRDTPIDNAFEDISPRQLLCHGEGFIATDSACYRGLLEVCDVLRMVITPTALPPRRSRGPIGAIAHVQRTEDLVEIVFSTCICFKQPKSNDR